MSQESPRSFLPLPGTEGRSHTDWGEGQCREPGEELSGTNVLCPQQKAQQEKPLCRRLLEEEGSVEMLSEAVAAFEHTEAD